MGTSVLGVVLLAGLLVVCSGCGSDPIVYQVTIRDFLPIWCMPFAEFQSYGITDVLAPNSDIGGGNVLRDSSFAQNQGSGVCPYSSYISSGEISGHPDFNRPVSILCY